MVIYYIYSIGEQLFTVNGFTVDNPPVKQKISIVNTDYASPLLVVFLMYYFEWKVGYSDFKTPLPQ